MPNNTGEISIIQTHYNTAVMVRHPLERVAPKADRLKSTINMINRLIILFAFSSLVAACQSTPKDTTGETGQPQSFGELITVDGAIPYHEMIAKMATADSLKVKVRGTVQSVCQAKGCWININDSQANVETFVKFKDYGFFMPKDCATREVIMEGYAYREVTSVEELRHYAEDEGKSKEEIEAITQPVEEMKFMASGVLLLPEEGKQ